MSIIERAAELLRPQGQDKPSALGDQTAFGEQDVIERAAASIGPRPSLAASNHAERPVAKDRPVRSSGVTTRMLQVDRNRLRAQSMITPEEGRTAIAESFRHVKRQILGNAANPKPGAPPANLVMVTSTFPGEGKTYCAINLAISMALEVDRTVLLVDADVAKGNIPPVLGFKAEKGLLDVLLDRHVELADVIWRTDIGSLSLLPAGSAHKHSTELLASRAMRGLLREMAESYHDRIIIFDTPPLLAASEASALASQMGQIVVVVEAGKTPETALKNALGRIDAGRVAGLLLNKTQGHSLEEGYGVYYG